MVELPSRYVLSDGPTVLYALVTLVIPVAMSSPAIARSKMANATYHIKFRSRYRPMNGQVQGTKLTMG